MDIKYNADIGAFVNTANDEPVTQAELLAWAAENPLPIDEPKKSNPALMKEVIESLTVKETPDTTEVGVETITDKRIKYLMATIDKSLPNQKTTVELPREAEIEEAVKEKVEEVQTEGGPVEIEMTEEGGAEVSFDPAVASVEGGQDHFENLAEFIGDDTLDELGSKLYDQYTEYKESRGDWEQSYREGLELLGFKYERRTEPFRGASGVNHPVLAEAVTQFQAQAYKELLPADGPVRAQILGL